jgi:hypothetical protein
MTLAEQIANLSQSLAQKAAKLGTGGSGTLNQQVAFLHAAHAFLDGVPGVKLPEEAEREIAGLRRQISDMQAQRASDSIAIEQRIATAVAAARQQWDEEHAKNFESAVGRRAIELMAMVGQPAPVPIGVGDHSGGYGQPLSVPGIARTKEFFRNHNPARS